MFSGLGVLIHQSMRLLMQKAKKVYRKYDWDSAEFLCPKSSKRGCHMGKLLEGSEFR